jgi:hypothetical protein
VSVALPSALSAGLPISVSRFDAACRYLNLSLPSCVTRRAISASSGAMAMTGTEGSTNTSKAIQRGNRVIISGSLRKETCE